LVAHSTKEYMQQFRLRQKLVRNKEKMEHAKIEVFNQLSTVYVQTIAYTASLGVSDEVVGRLIRKVFQPTKNQLLTTDVIVDTFDQLAEILHDTKSSLFVGEGNPDGRYVGDEGYLHMKSIINNAKQSLSDEYLVKTPSK